MNHWLVKTEPGTYSWDDLCRDGRTSWDGVRNFQARNHIRAMRSGDLALVYHSVSERCVVGVARIASEPYPDRTAKSGDWTAVDLEPAFALGKPVGLEQIRADRALASMVLVKQSRLSVQPVSKAEFERIVSLGGKSALG
jgi:predicted RNA-binding protein with PUA-like domain